VVAIEVNHGSIAFDWDGPASGGDLAAMRVLRSLLLLLALAGVVLPLPGTIDAPRRAAGKTLAMLPSPKIIALSFDDVPRAPGAFYTKDERTIRLIAGLQAAHVRQVAMFVNPGRIGATDGSAERIAAYTAAGHVLGDHSFSHRDLSSMPAANFLADIDKAEGWLKGRPGYRPWFRFPGLNQGGKDQVKRRTVLDGLAARGLLVAGVTVDGSDWYLERLALDAQKAGRPMDVDALRDLYVETMVQSADFSDALMRRTIGRSPAHVMLLHETDLAARYIGPLVDGLRRDGWTIVPVDTAYADQIYHVAPNVPSDNGTLSEAIAWEKGITGPRWYDRNDMKVAGALFEARVMHQPALAAAPAAQPPPARPVALLRRVSGWHRKCFARHGRYRRPCPAFAATAGPVSLLGSAA
jgi:peptidoglycan/xylan/chitin deacetylase (PgdA/CDA1 family)